MKNNLRNLPNRFGNLFLIILSVLYFSCTSRNNSDKPVPAIENRGKAVQLIVDGKPWLALAGELHNSSSSSSEYMKDVWPGLEQSGMNTVLAGVEWSLIEPEEGKFNFTVVDDLLESARKHHLRLILLWFGSWKNGQSHYPPEWVKENYIRFPRAKLKNGKSLEILTPFSIENFNQDAAALIALMKHLKETDSEQRTVIMMQVENEVGILGASRDYSNLADSAYYSPVPLELSEYLSMYKDRLLPELAEAWSSNGFKVKGTWGDLFGKNLMTDEIFMAWQYATYIDRLVMLAKTEYPVPMYVNAWIIQPTDKHPGDYPSGGPQAHMLDIWRAGAPHLDIYCPDIYLPNFTEICKMYTQNNNTLFIPESRAGEQGVGQLFYAIGRHKAIGYSPFGFENRVKDMVNGPIPKAYKLLAGMAPVILDAQSKGTITGVLMKKDIHPSEEIEIGGYKLLVELLKSRYSDTVPEQGYGIIINSAVDEYIIAGKNIQISFSPSTEGPAIAALAWVDEGRFDDGKWIPRRRLNGDAIMLDYHLANKAEENKTGTGLKFTGDDRMIQHVKLYRYE